VHFQRVEIPYLLSTCSAAVYTAKFVRRLTNQVPGIPVHGLFPVYTFSRFSEAWHTLAESRQLVVHQHRIFNTDNICVVYVSTLPPSPDCAISQQAVIHVHVLQLHFAPMI